MEGHNDSNRYEVSTDVIYQESLNEMRHHRTSEISTTNWNAVIMLAVIGGELTIKTQIMNIHEEIVNPIIFSDFKLLFGFFILFQTASTLYSIFYSHSRYVLQREHARKYFIQKIEVTALDYVEQNEKPIYKTLKLYIFLMIGTGFLGFIAFLFLLIL